jgi:hypothetical protein
MEEKHEASTPEEVIRGNESIMTNNKEELAMVFHELEMARRMVKPLVVEDMHDMMDGYSTMAILHLLLSITEEKLGYYQKKYNFQVDHNDAFYPEETAELLRLQSKQSRSGGPE